MNQDQSVQPLRKIKLAVQAGATAGAMDIPLPVAEVAFILGIGSSGLTPLECLLNGRKQADTMAFRVAGPEAALFFGHVAPSLGRWAERRDEVYFTVTVVAVETPQPREVIKAMADMTAHGHADGCDCGCGCS